MGTRKTFHPKLNNIYPTSAETEIPSTSHTHLYEFNESDLWNPNLNQSSPFDPKKPMPRSKETVRGSKTTCPTVTASSLPLKIPDWSKILKADYREHGKIEINEEVDDWKEEDEDKIPPHEYLARRRGASFSVHEGIGRTLKGRDLSRVRNAIWKKTGFED